MGSSSTVWDILPAQISHPSIESDSFWSEYQHTALGTTIHVAILSRNYLKLILQQSKTIESRISVDRRMPYKRVKKGDIILLKQTGGPIIGLSYVSNVDFYEKIDELKLEEIKERYSSRLQIQDEAYWERFTKSSYITLIHLDHVSMIEPIRFTKRDRNAWVIFEPDC